MADSHRDAAGTTGSDVSLLPEKTTNHYNSGLGRHSVKLFFNENENAALTIATD